VRKLRKKYTYLIMCMHTCIHIIYNHYVIWSWAKSGYHQWISPVNMIYKHL
jgi:Ser-tRNA(Ala) deacylase AlaX